MSGHSHWATTKRTKGIRDDARGRLFSKLAKQISIAAKVGVDPSSNSKLRFAVEQARAANMPKTNIDRAIASGSKSGVEVVELFYEGFAPGGVGVVVEASTDNRNRTSAEIKNIFERRGGSLSGPGSVMFNFEPKGQIVIEGGGDELVLTLIDMGAEDVEQMSSGIEVYTQPSELNSMRGKIERKGLKIKSFDLVKKPKNLVEINDAGVGNKVQELLAELSDHEEIDRVFANMKLPPNLTQN